MRSARRSNERSRELTPPGSPRRPAAGRADGDERLAAAALVELLGGGGQDAPAGRGERVADRQRGAVDVELRAVDRAERLVEAEALAAELGVLPRRERRQDLGGERLVDLEEVEVLEGEAGALEHPRDRVGGRHEQPVVAVDVVDRRGLGA